ncbi:predicted protein [Chaetomium globosum CBS 148.51]|uniref:Uncharacterized protein n=1 Tax=Chaetomium globosum (strain ATCC 6205 / CBS 148.51 / DSM 1962 / NBRC 6347 / NRRL 1970) TaxID=306901 RepID=Q2HCE5_CHAGB|nr:uncharacterized protein CHGG_02109 [Chaetomium globosum CBS 148.51]EAQ93874.1 predicted protein [Chaetomium globosum CBS 148.51]
MHPLSVTLFHQSGGISTGMLRACPKSGDGSMTKDGERVDGWWNSPWAIRHGCCEQRGLRRPTSMLSCCFRFRVRRIATCSGPISRPLTTYHNPEKIPLAQAGYGRGIRSRWIWDLGHARAVAHSALRGSSHPSAATRFNQTQSGDPRTPGREQYPLSEPA